MRISRIAAIALSLSGGCKSDRGGPAVAGNGGPAADPHQAAAASTRCLPVVAASCGCVYSCGVGTAQPDGRYRVRHPFWKDSDLTARVDRWCVGKECTDAFFADVVCSGICAPKPADPSCHFEGTRCVSGRESP